MLAFEDSGMKASITTAFRTAQGAITSPATTSTSAVRRASVRLGISGHHTAISDRDQQQPLTADQRHDADRRSQCHRRQRALGQPRHQEEEEHRAQPVEGLGQHHLVPQDLTGQEGERDPGHHRLAAPEHLASQHVQRGHGQRAQQRVQDLARRDVLARDAVDEREQEGEGRRPLGGRAARRRAQPVAVGQRARRVVVEELVVEQLRARGRRSRRRSAGPPARGRRSAPRGGCRPGPSASSSGQGGSAHGARAGRACRGGRAPAASATARVARRRSS